MGLSRTVSKIAYTVISVENRKIFPPRTLLPTEGVPLGIGYRRSGSKKLASWGYRAERSLTISSAVCIQYTNATDRRTDTGRQQNRRLCTVSTKYQRVSDGQNSQINIARQYADAHQKPCAERRRTFLVARQCAHAQQTAAKTAEEHILTLARCVWPLTRFLWIFCRVTISCWSEKKRLFWYVEVEYTVFWFSLDEFIKRHK